MSETPIYMNQVCYGLDLRNYDVSKLRQSKRINIQWIIDLYNAYPDKAKFFDRTQSNQMGSIDGLSGDANFKNQIAAGLSVKEIQQSWEPKLSEYKKMRQQYLLYK